MHQGLEVLSFSSRIHKNTFLIVHIEGHSHGPFFLEKGCVYIAFQETILMGSPIQYSLTLGPLHNQTSLNILQSTPLR